MHLERNSFTNMPKIHTRIPDLGVEGSLAGPIVSTGCSVLVWTIVEGVERDEALERTERHQ